MERFRERWRTADGLTRWALVGVVILLAGSAAFAACVLLAVLYLGAQRATALASSTAEPAEASPQSTTTTVPSPVSTAIAANPAPAGPATQFAPRATALVAASAAAATPKSGAPAAATPSAAASVSAATPKPGSAASPTSTVVSVSPSAAPPTVTPAPQALSGTGIARSAKFALNDGLTTFRIKHNGAKAFNVWLSDGQGNHISQLVSTQGAFDGARALGLAAGSNYALDVQADGAWSALVEQPAPSAADLKLPQTFSGRSAQASPFLSLKEGAVTFRLSYTGNGGISIWLLDQSGIRQVLIARSATSTATQVAVVGAGSYVLDIAGEGEWSISLSQ